MAFSVEGYSDKKNKDDPRYVKLMARMVYKDNGEAKDKVLKLHKCTEKDWNKFD